MPNGKITYANNFNHCYVGNNMQNVIPLANYNEVISLTNGSLKYISTTITEHLSFDNQVVFTSSQRDVTALENYSVSLFDNNNLYPLRYNIINITLDNGAYSMTGSTSNDFVCECTLQSPSYASFAYCAGHSASGNIYNIQASNVTESKAALNGTTNLHAEPFGYNVRLHANRAMTIHLQFNYMLSYTIQALCINKSVYS